MNLPNFGHHLLQLVPFISVAVILSLDLICQNVPARQFHRVLLLIVVFLIFISASASQTPRPNFAASNRQYRIIEALQSIGINHGSSILSPRYPLVYVVFEAKPLPSFFVHPANLSNTTVLSLWKGESWDSKSAFMYLLDSQPKWLVLEDNSVELFWFKNSSLFQNYQKRDIELDLGINVWQRMEN